MIVKNSIKIVLLGGTLLLGGCASGYLVKDIEGGRVAMTAEYDKNPDRDAEAILQPYRRVVDSIMSPVVGHSARALEAYRPESPLSNLLADIIRRGSGGHFRKAGGRRRDEYGRNTQFAS